MNNEKLTTDNTQLIQKLRSEYISLKERVNSMNAFLINIDFERRVPDPEEQCLMQGKYNSMLNYLMNLRHCIMYYERQQLENTHHCSQDAHDPCGELGTEGNPIPLPSPVDDGSAVVNEAQVPNSLKGLVGMQVVSVMPPGWKCQGCVYDSDDFRCEKKVELVGGYMLCLAQIDIVTE